VALHAQKAFDVLLKNGLTKISLCILINFIELTLNTLPRFSAGLTHEKFFIEILFLFSLVLKETKLFSLFERKKLQKRSKQP